MSLRALALFVCSLLPVTAAAIEVAPQLVWESGGIPVTMEPGGDIRAVAVGDGAGGAIYAWAASTGLYAQRTDANGLKLWPDPGIRVADLAVGTHTIYAQDNAAIVSDGAGGAIVSWRQDDPFGSDYVAPNLYVQRLDPAGRRLWGAAGKRVAASYHPGEPRIAPDGAGGVYVTWTEIRNGAFIQVWAQRFSAAGTKPWAADGVPVSDGSTHAIEPKIAEDGAGSAVIVWNDGPLRAQKIGPTGQLAWQPGGNVISGAGGSIAMANDGDGGTLVTWTLGAAVDPVNDSDVYAQRLDPEGNPLWTDGGLAVVIAPQHQQNPAIVSDGEGGAIVAWDHGVTPESGYHEAQIRAQRVRADGSLLWGDGVVPFATSATDPKLISDGTGGALLLRNGRHDGWFENTGPSIWIQRLDAEGAPLWGADGAEVHYEIGGHHGFDAKLLSDGDGGAIVHWKDYRHTGEWDVYAQRVSDHSLSRPAILRTMKLGERRGTIVSDDGTIDCGDTCNAAYESPTTVTVRAIADPGFRFVGWDGECGDEEACTVEMTADRSLAATFVRAPVDLAVFRPSTGTWFVDLSGNGLYDGCALDVCKAPFGMTGDLPVVGDWTGSGVSTIGVFRPSNGYWFLDLDGDSRWDGCAIDGCFGPFGQPGDLPIAIDWFGIGIHLLGVFRPSNGMWYIDLNADGRHDGCNTADGCLGPFGTVGDVPVVGDWDDWGFDYIGVFRPSTGFWYLDRNLEGWWEGCQIEHCVGAFGMKGDQPVVGDWDGDGKRSIGIFRPSTGYWYLDQNGNRRWDGFVIDSARGPFGGKNDRAVPVPW